METRSATINFEIKIKVLSVIGNTPHAAKTSCETVALRLSFVATGMGLPEGAAAMSLRNQGENPHQFDLDMMLICLKLAWQASSLGEVPVGALVVHEGEILSEGHNLCERLNDPTAHAERLVLSAAGEARRSWRLDGCTLYATLEPCSMCAGAIVQSRLDRLVYGASDAKAGACRSLYRLTEDPRLNHQVRVTPGMMWEPCAEVLSQFFQHRR